MTTKHIEIWPLWSLALGGLCALWCLGCNTLADTGGVALEDDASGCCQDVEPADAEDDPGSDPSIDAQADVADDLGQDTDADVDAEVDTGPDLPPETGPRQILVIGNGLLAPGPMLDLVAEAAQSFGFWSPEITSTLPDGFFLSDHRDSPETLDLLSLQTWDVVILQDHSARATEAQGDPPTFLDDATFFHDEVRRTSPDATIVFFEPWVPHPNHPVYPDFYANAPAALAEIRDNYNLLVGEWLPTHATDFDPDKVVIAPVGDAWEMVIESTDLRLHDVDDQSAGPEGQWLTALVLYATLFERAAETAVVDGLDDDVVAELYNAANAVVPDTYTAPPVVVYPPGLTVQIDFGGEPTPPPWNNVLSEIPGTTFGLTETAGRATPISMAIVDAFTGINGNGLVDSAIYPDTVTGDSVWCGSHTGHDEGRMEPAELEIRNLDDGPWRLSIYASRAGDDDGRGRLTRYRVGDTFQDLEAADNDSLLSFDSLEADDGVINLRVEVSPDGTGRYCYVGAIELERLE